MDQSNTIESVASAFKRGIGVYQHYNEAHLHRYLAQFDSRSNRRAAVSTANTERYDQFLVQITGRRLTCCSIGEANPV